MNVMNLDKMCTIKVVKKIKIKPKKCRDFLNILSKLNMISSGFIFFIYLSTVAIKKTMLIIIIRHFTIPVR